MKKSRYSILLGGLCGDAHSIGLFILRNVLEETGYKVYFLGNQNTPADFIRYSKFVNIVMVSSMDGHAKQYLKGFSIEKSSNEANPLWYLGGNLTIRGNNDEITSNFLEMGFDRVYPRFVAIDGVVRVIAKDIKNKIPICETNLENLIDPKPDKGFVPLTRGPQDSHLKDRENVLSSWPTGSAASDLDENATFLESCPSFSALLNTADSGNHPIILQPRSGTLFVDAQKVLFQELESAGAHALSYQIDSLTRNNAYTLVETTDNNDTLNGFPLVNHGVEALRSISRSIKVPLQTRHSTRDPRLLAEISYAGGVSAFEGGAICYNIPYYKNYSLINYYFVE